MKYNVIAEYPSGDRGQFDVEADTPAEAGLQINAKNLKVLAVSLVQETDSQPAPVTNVLQSVSAQTAISLINVLLAIDGSVEGRRAVRRVLIRPIAWGVFWGMLLWFVVFPACIAIILFISTGLWKGAVDATTDAVDLYRYNQQPPRR